MKELLKYTRANVRITDKKTGCLLFTDSNLFVDTGRVFIANTLMNTIEGGGFIDRTKYACDFGDSSQSPIATDTDLICTVIGNAAIDAGGPTVLAGAATGLNFQFIYTAGILITIRELGLFYRPLSDTFPVRGSIPANMTGKLLARLRTTLSSITIVSGQSITINWKIIF